jgi:predicted secreted protein
LDGFRDLGSARRRRLADIEIREKGTRVTASPGDRIVIRLPENATTGYQWQVEQVADRLELESSEMIPPAEAAPGAGGERRVVLRARGAGQAQVALKLERPWEWQPTDRFEFDVTVS